MHVYCCMDHIVYTVCDTHHIAFRFRIRHKYYSFIKSKTIEIIVIKVQNIVFGD